VFILAAERDGVPGVGRYFEDYREYLAANRHRFPPSAFALATSSWYYGSSDHRAPHDAWLEEARIEEPASGERSERRVVALRVRLLGAYHDGHIELFYPRVYRYQLNLDFGEHGHRDWRYDEFRLTDEGHLLHEIEWSGRDDTGRWLIEASDVEFSWIPGGSR
jgi:hypothetical protein